MLDRQYPSQVPLSKPATRHILRIRHRQKDLTIHLTRLSIQVRFKQVMPNCRVPFRGHAPIPKSITSFHSIYAIDP